MDGLGVFPWAYICAVIAAPHFTSASCMDNLRIHIVFGASGPMNFPDAGKATNRNLGGVISEPGTRNAKASAVCFTTRGGF